MNQCYLIGRLTKDAEVRVNAQDNTKIMVMFSIAVNREYKDQNGQTPVDFINCQAYGSPAQVINKYTKKGDKVALMGRIQTRSYQAQDGTNRNVVEVLVEKVELLEPVSQPNQDARQQPQQPQQPKGNDIKHPIIADDDSLPF